MLNFESTHIHVATVKLFKLWGQNVQVETKMRFDILLFHGTELEQAPIRGYNFFFHALLN